MNIMMTLQSIKETTSGVSEGFIILNFMGSLWDMQLYRTEKAAWDAIHKHCGYSDLGFHVAPATRTFTWEKTDAASPHQGEPG